MSFPKRVGKKGRYESRKAPPVLDVAHPLLKVLREPRLCSVYLHDERITQKNVGFVDCSCLADRVGLIYQIDTSPEAAIQTVDRMGTFLGFPRPPALR